ncbi:MAG: PrsW family intramembrane metalloprotease [Chloroflexi bacterium]|nr:PrsW family intramembrane metalloprotease [Chloroflexota bacterium]
MQRFFSSNHNRSILLLVFGVISILVLLGRGVFLAVDGLLSFAGSDLTFSELGPSALDALSMLVCAGLLIPLIVGSIRQLQGKELPAARLPPIKGRHFLLLAIVWVVMLAASSLLTGLFDFGWLLSAPAFLLAMVIPVAALAWTGAGGLVGGSRRRLWAAFGLGMTGGTGLALVLEYVLVAVAVAIGAVAIILRPELAVLLEDLQAQADSAKNVEELLTLLAPYLTQPWVFLAVLAFASGFGPLIEEAVKPLAVWILGRRLRSPAEGFALGALSGAGFALLEGLMAASGMAETPYFGLPARLASSLMHITLSALMGWGIASAMLEKRWKRLIGVYVLCAALHGLWNGSALLAVYGSLRFVVQGMTYDPVSILAMVAGVALLGLVFLFIAVGLPILNRRFQPTQSDIIAPLATQPERTPDGFDSKSS